MLKKIYQELVTIRKELQAIRSGLESCNDIANVSAKINHQFAEVHKKTIR